MKSYRIERVFTKEQLDYLYDNSAFTMEGLAEDSIEDLIKWIEELNAFTEAELVVYITKGNLMNEAYNLTGTNTYPSDCTIVSVLGINQIKVAVPRFTIGARWFSDIVDNNLMRENEA